MAIVGLRGCGGLHLEGSLLEGGMSLNRHAASAMNTNNKNAALKHERCRYLTPENTLCTFAITM